MSADGASTHAAKTNVLLDVVARQFDRPPQRILVVGCGSGYEAGILARRFSAETFGIDIESEFALDHEAAKPAVLRIMDARELEFADAAFDLVYSFHALEHIAEFRRALREMSRVLRPGGTFCIGTPNKARLVGYIGSPVPFRTKVFWNLVDFSLRARRRWSNEQGAHAGFDAAELNDYCLTYFGNVIEITNDYYLALYRRWDALLKPVIATHLRNRLLPCVYFTGHKIEGVASDRSQRNLGPGQYLRGSRFAS